MEGNELSNSEYLKCNNACVKVTINRYRGLCSDSWPCIPESLDLADDAGEWARSFFARSFSALIQRLYQITEDVEREEIHHGSGFVIADNFVITNKHVIDEVMSDRTLEVRILNETIRDMPCVVVHCDAGSDLALLCCFGLNLRRRGICPLDLSEVDLWPGLSVFSFGYPFTHAGRSALFVEGKVSGSEERYGREPFVVLSCALNPGNSGSPVFRRIGDDIKVVGVVAQKHKKDILTIEEIDILEEERSTLNSASDSRDHFRKSLLLKMYDALNETHCQFGYGNMVPGHLVVKFLSDPFVTSIMDFLEEMEL